MRFLIKIVGGSLTENLQPQKTNAALVKLKVGD